jgi:ankyrin repeat protein
LIAITGALVAIFEAVKRGRLDTIRWLIEEESIDPHIRSGSYLVLANTMERDDVDCVKYLIGHNVKVFFTPHYQKLLHHPDGFHPLYTAMHYGSSRVVGFLLDELMIDINVVNTQHHSALFYAYMNGKLAIASMLVRNGIDTSLEDEDGYTVLEHVFTKAHIRYSGSFLELLAVFKDPETRK